MPSTSQWWQAKLRAVELQNLTTRFPPLAAGLLHDMQQRGHFGHQVCDFYFRSVFGELVEIIYNNRYIGAHVHSLRYDEVVKLCGGNGWFVTEAGGKPAVIHVKVDPEAVISFCKDALKKQLAMRSMCAT